MELDWWVMLITRTAFKRLPMAFLGKTSAGLAERWSTFITPHVQVQETTVCHPFPAAFTRESGFSDGSFSLCHFLFSALGISTVADSGQIR